MYEYIKIMVSFAVLYLSIVLLSCTYTYKHNGYFENSYSFIENDDPIAIPFHFENSRIFFEASINGKKGKFLFDTGAPVSCVDVPTDNLQYLGKVAYNAMGHRENSKVYALKEITISDISLNIHSTIITAKKYAKEMYKGEGFDGILGIDVFNGYWCEVSFSKNAVVLHKEKPDYFTESVSAEYIRRNNNFHIMMPVELDNQSVYLAIDTGMPDAIRFPRSIIQKKQRKSYTRLFSTDRVKKSYLLKTYSFTIFDETFTGKSVITNSYYPKDHTIGLLGINFLKYYDFLLDLTDITMSAATAVYYKPLVSASERDYGLYSFITHVPASGILKIHAHHNGVVIDDILEDSPAYHTFGLRPNMVITKVNGTAIREIPGEILYSPSFPDTVIECTVLENGKERTIVRKKAAK